MTNFLLIALCIGLGMLFTKLKLVPQNSHKGINAWLLNIALPAVSFKYLPYIEWRKELLWPVLAPIIIWLCASVYAKVYSRIRGLDKKTEAVLKIVCGLGNTSFIGFPLIMAWYSEAELSIAIICDQVTFLLFSTVGLLVAVRASGTEKVTAGFMLKRLLMFPAFLGCVLAIILPQFLDISPLAPLFDKLASTVAPLALFSIGLQLKFNGWKDEIKEISAALFYKLLLGPAIFFTIILLAGAKGIIAQISVFEAAMPILLSASIIAEKYDLRPQLTNMIIGIGILVGIITTAGWWLVLHTIA